MQSYIDFLLRNHINLITLIPNCYDMLKCRIMYIVQIVFPYFVHYKEKFWKLLQENLTVLISFITPLICYHLFCSFMI